MATPTDIVTSGPYAEWYSDAYRGCHPVTAVMEATVVIEMERAREPNTSRIPTATPRIWPEPRRLRAYPGRYGYTPAFDNGARTATKGREDVRDNDRYDPPAQVVSRGRSRLQREYGQREETKTCLARLHQGYDRGYREGRRR